MKTILVENDYEIIREARAMKVYKAWEKGELEDLQTIRALEFLIRMLHDVTCAIILSGQPSDLVNQYVEIHQLLYRSYKEKTLSHYQLFLLWEKAGGKIAS